MASIAQYLLRLTQEPAENEKFRSSSDAAKASMSAAGLSVEQQEVLLCGDPQRIAAAVQIEIEASAPAEAAAGLRVPITFCFCPPAR